MTGQTGTLGPQFKVSRFATFVFTISSKLVPPLLTAGSTTKTNGFLGKFRKSLLFLTGQLTTGRYRVSHLLVGSPQDRPQLTSDLAVIRRKMPLNFLRDLPQEVRDDIYSYFLVSPSGHVTTSPPGPWSFEILPWDIRQEIIINSYIGSRTLDLSLLRTSKQVNRECKDIVWRRNAVVFRIYEIPLHNAKILGKNPGPLVAARHVVLPIDMTAVWDVEATAEAMNALGGWSQAGSLNEVTVIVANERRRPFEERDPQLETLMKFKSSLEKIIRFRTGNWFEDHEGSFDFQGPENAKACFQGYLSILHDARYGCLSHLKRTMIVNTNFWLLSFEDQEKYLQEALMDPNELMVELHESFGGELWIDGILCYKDGVQIVEAFRPSSEDEAGRIRAIDRRINPLRTSPNSKGLLIEGLPLNNHGHEVRAQTQNSTAAD